MNELIWRAQSGDQKAMSEIIDSNAGLVWNIAKRFTFRGYDIEELFQVGCMGFIKAIKKFDVSYDVQLSTYAVTMIMGEIKRFIRDNGSIKVSRSLKELSSKIRDIQEEQVKSGREEFTMEELEKKLNVSKEDIIMALDAALYVDSLDRKISEDDVSSIGERIPCEEKEYNNLLDKLTIESILHKLDENERKVIIFRYYKEKTQTEISKILGISQVQVSRLEKKALSRLKNFV